jgi:hypothetical protein
MEALFHGLPFDRILGSVVQAIRGSPPSRSTTLGKEGLEAKLEFRLFSEVECVYLGEREEGASIGDTSKIDTRSALPFQAHARA